MSSFPGHLHMQKPAYTSTILTITHRSCPDPYVLLHNGTYYMTFTCGSHIELWSAPSLFDLEQKCRKEVIWRPEEGKEYSQDLWAPEIHVLEGRWWVYFAATSGEMGNRGHRMFVLRGPREEGDPMDGGEWEFEGRVGGMDEGQWAIDGTVISLHSSLYFVYSGWPPGITHNESRQELFIAKMRSPTECEGRAIRISTPDLQFEYSGMSGINEGPQILRSPDGKWTGIVYSCAGSWTSEYKMNILWWTGGDPLSPFSWCKSNTPLLQSANKPLHAPGHGNFVHIPAGADESGSAGRIVGEEEGGGKGDGEIWAVFHATDEKTGWDGRKARVMRVGWKEGGPYMGSGVCGRGCGVVEHFIDGCPGGECGGECGGEEGGEKRVWLDAREKGGHGDFKPGGMKGVMRDVGNATKSVGREVGKVGGGIGKVGKGLMGKFSSK